LTAKVAKLPALLIKKNPGRPPGLNQTNDLRFYLSASETVVNVAADTSRMNRSIAFIDYSL